MAESDSVEIRKVITDAVEMGVLGDLASTSDNVIEPVHIRLT
jgi:hypothetical protein